MITGDVRDVPDCDGSGSFSSQLLSRIRMIISPNFDGYSERDGWFYGKYIEIHRKHFCFNSSSSFLRQLVAAACGRMIGLMVSYCETEHPALPSSPVQYTFILFRMEDTGKTLDIYDCIVCWFSAGHRLLNYLE